MPPTQKELAKFSGLSSGTVSNVIRGAEGVSEKSRRKVLEAIKALNYRPNLIARSLKTNRTNTLGMVVPDITIPFFPKLIRGAESAAQKRGFFLIVLDSENNEDREASMLDLLRSQRVEGILLIAAGDAGRQAAPNDDDSGWRPPLVYVDRLPRGHSVDSVCVDDFHAAEMAVSHLMERGHKNIAIITGPVALQNEKERLRGYRKALNRGGLPVKDSLIWRGSFERDEIASLCQKGVLRSIDRPTAVFATNGVTGLAALRSIYAMGLKTPQDIAFVSFDELTVEEFFRPGITSIVQPAYEIGYHAVETLLERIKKGNSAHLQTIRLQATLRVRESSSAPMSQASIAKVQKERQALLKQG